MIYVDTNILIRLITGDVPELAQRALVLIDAADSRVYAPDIVFTELFFVLENNPQYRMARKAVCDGVEELLRSGKIARSDEVDQALLIAAHHPKLDFTDCMLAVYAGKSSNLLSFDKDLNKFLARPAV